MIPSMLRKITISSIFGHRFQHIIRQIVCVPSMYNIIMLKTKWDNQMKYTFIFRKLSSVILFLRQCSKERNIWKKIKSSSIVLIISDKNVWAHFDFMNKCNMNQCDRKNTQFQNYSSHENFIVHTFPGNTTFVQKFSMLPIQSSPYYRHP